MSEININSLFAGNNFILILFLLFIILSPGKGKGCKGDQSWILILLLLLILFVPQKGKHCKF